MDLGDQADQEPQPTAPQIPRAGQAGWYVAFGTTVLPAPIHSIVWEGDHFTAVAAVPGQEMQLSGQVDRESAALAVTITTPQGTAEMQGEPAEKYKNQLASLVD